MITHATIMHYKGIADARLDFGPVNVVVGQNGVGKSNIIDALSIIHDSYKEDLDTALTKRHGIESVRQWSKTRPYHITLEITFAREGGVGKYGFSLASARGNFKIIEEHGEWSGPDTFDWKGDGPEGRIHSTFHRNEHGELIFNTDGKINSRVDQPLKIGQGDLFLTSLSGPFSTMESMLFFSLATEVSDFSAYSIYPNTLRQPQIVTRDDTLNSDGSNLATILRKMNTSHRRERDELIEAMRVVMPILSEVLVRSAGGYYVPLLRVQEPGNDPHDFNMSQVSDGTLRMLGLLTALYQPQSPHKIALEEPEQMVHPGALPVLSDAIHAFTNRVESPDRQIFLTTHSPSFLDLFQPESVIWATLDNGLTACGPISKRQLALVKDQLFTPGEILVSEGFFG